MHGGRFYVNGWRVLWAWGRVFVGGRFVWGRENEQDSCEECAREYGAGEDNVFVSEGEAFGED